MPGSMRVSFWVRLLLCLCSMPQLFGQGDLVRLDARLDRTAIWAGDLLEYRISLLYDEKVEIIRDNLKKEDLNLDPFVLVDLKTRARSGGPGRKALDLVLFLKTLNEPGGEAVIPPLTIYYATRKPGPLGKGAEIETHTLVVPEQRVGLRSALTSQSRDIRDLAELEPLRFPARLLWIPGWILLGFVALWVGHGVLLRYRQRDLSQRKIDRRAVERAAFSELDAVASSADNAGLPGSCNRISQIVKKTITELTEIEAESFTPEELQRELLERDRRVDEQLVGRITEVLRDCESTSYARPDSLDGNKDLRKVIRDSKDLISRLVQL